MNNGSNSNINIISEIFSDLILEMCQWNFRQTGEWSTHFSLNDILRYKYTLEHSGMESENLNNLMEKFKERGIAFTSNNLGNLIYALRLENKIIEAQFERSDEFFFTDPIINPDYYDESSRYQIT